MVKSCFGLEKKRISKNSKVRETEVSLRNWKKSSRIIFFKPYPRVCLLIWERQREGQRQRENVRNFSWLPLSRALTGDETHNLGVRPGQSLNLSLLVYKTTLQPTEPPSQGCSVKLFISLLLSSGRGSKNEEKRLYKWLSTKSFRVIKGFTFYAKSKVEKLKSFRHHHCHWLELWQSFLTPFFASCQACMIIMKFNHDQVALLLYTL